MPVVVVVFELMSVSRSGRSQLSYQGLGRTEVSNQD